MIAGDKLFAELDWKKKYPWIQARSDGIYCAYCSHSHASTRNKTPIRNRLKTTTLDHLIRIAMTGPPLSDWDAVPALRNWEVMGKRKITSSK